MDLDIFDEIEHEIDKRVIRKLIKEIVDVNTWYQQKERARTGWRISSVLIVSTIAAIAIRIDYKYVNTLQFDYLSFRYVFHQYMVCQIIILSLILLFKLLEKKTVNIQSLGFGFPLDKEIKLFVISTISLVIIIAAFFTIISQLYFPIRYPYIWHYRHAQLLAESFGRQDYITLAKLLIPQIFFLVILAPIIEETLVTGILFQGLRERLNIVFSLIIPCLYMVSLHVIYNPYPGIPDRLPDIINFFTQLLSLILFTHFRSIYPSIFFHFSRNFFVLTFQILTYIS